MVVPGGPCGAIREMKSPISAWPTIEAWAEGVAGLACDLLAQRTDSPEIQGRTLTIALSGGNSPPPALRALQTRLLQECNLASRCRWFQVDERAVAMEHADRNGRMIRESLFGGNAAMASTFFEVPWPPPSISGTTPFAERTPAAETAVNVCTEVYSTTLRTHLAFGTDGQPIFDLVFLGMGDDGHTASLFPGTEEQIRPSKLFQPVWVEKLRTWRFTLTMPVLIAARHVVVLVCGEGKMPLVRRVLAGEADSLPIGRLMGARQSRGLDLDWWIQPGV